MRNEKLVLGMLVFEGFELLDVFGPLEMFGFLKEQVEIFLIGERLGKIQSTAGPSVIVDKTFEDLSALDILMIPGGAGTRTEVTNESLIQKISRLARSSKHVATICTGAALLAKTGLLDDRRATTNKRAYNWVVSQNEKVNWIHKARWVEDANFFTSSGISAGTDMSLALIAKLFGREQALAIAQRTEYNWDDDSTNDRFAELNKLLD
ncbi:DJ-1/PfpI family protein [Sphingobacterium sp. DR205]|uniref:DJ-1/PfpI family protein n=1 Tax=Sphingobacterium sp. DR205 TaxID=2713573 RepID=UPI0019D1CA67|nr:DJ-1/PfpI family protein [Sphingobacterium sp. DR205]